MIRNERSEMNKLSNHQSKIPIAITRVRKGGAVAKVESNLKRNDKPLKRKEPVTSRTPRTVKKVPNFKKLHRQFEAHIARGKVKKKQPTVFVEFPTRANKENLPQTQKKRNHNDSRKSKVYKQDEVTLTSIPSVSMVTKVNKGHHHEEDFMMKFKELCKQYQTSYRQQPLPRQRPLQINTKQSGQLDTSAAFKSLVEKAVCSQHHKYTARRRPLVSPGYTRGMREASEVMLRSVKRFCEPQQYYHRQLDDVRANLAEQLDSCSDLAADGDSNFIQRSCSRRRNTMILRSRELDT